MWACVRGLVRYSSLAVGAQRGCRAVAQPWLAAQRPRALHPGVCAAAAACVRALQDAASLRPAAAGVLRELLAAGAGRGGGPAIYVMAHVESDVGEAVVRGALEHAGLVGAGPGQLPPHR